MGNIREVKINDYSIIFENLEEYSQYISSDVPLHDSAKIDMINKPLEWTEDMLQNSLKPIIDILSCLHRESKRLNPDELELNMNLKFALNGKVPIIKVLSFASECQFSVKFVWKK